MFVIKGMWLMKCYHESGCVTNFWNMRLLTLEIILYFPYLSLILDAESLWVIIRLDLRNFSEDFIITIFNTVGKIVNNNSNQETMKLCSIAVLHISVQRCTPILLLGWHGRNLTPGTLSVHTRDAWQCRYRPLQPPCKMGAKSAVLSFFFFF